MYGRRDSCSIVFTGNSIRGKCRHCLGVSGAGCFDGELKGWRPGCVWQKRRGDRIVPREKNPRKIQGVFSVMMDKRPVGNRKPEGARAPEPGPSAPGGIRGALRAAACKAAGGAGVHAAGACGVLLPAQRGDGAVIGWFSGSSHEEDVRMRN